MFCLEILNKLNNQAAEEEMSRPFQRLRGPCPENLDVVGQMIDSQDQATPYTDQDRFADMLKSFGLGLQFVWDNDSRAYVMDFTTQTRKVKFLFDQNGKFDFLGIEL
jgi:hypothetical protein